MKKKLKLLSLCLTALLLSFTTLFVPVHADDDASQIKMWRLYNPNSGEHFYTADVSERDHLYDVGWNIEGVGWVAPSTGYDVYRLYNPYAGDHHYTMSQEERDGLVQLGWRDEGVGWKSGGSVVMQREYNPFAFACNHNYTSNPEEHTHLVSLGWRDEGNAWNAIAGGSSEGARIHEKAAEGTYAGPFVATASGSKFHRPNCPTIKNRTITRTFNTLDEAKNSGLEPCHDCLKELAG